MPRERHTLEKKATRNTKSIRQDKMPEQKYKSENLFNIYLSKR